MSRALDNNNPGNLRPGAGRVLWDGQTGTDPDGFAVFKSKEDGLAAARQQVLLDYNQHGLKTPMQLASKYTKTDQAAYAQRLADALGISVNDDAKLSDPAHFATYMGQLYGNEDSKAATPQDPASEFDAAASVAGPQSGGDFDNAANLATNAPQDDHYAAATGAPDAFAAALSADLPSIKDKTTSAVNDILKNGGGEQEITDYFAAQGYPVRPEDVKGAVAAYKAGKPYTIPIDVTPPAPSGADELGAGLDRGLRDVVGTVGDAAAWADRNVPGALWLDNALGRATGVQGNAIGQAANSHIIGDAYNAGAYGQSPIAGAGRIAGNLALSAPLIMGGEGVVAPVLADALPTGAVEFAAGRGGANLLTRGASLASRGVIGGAEYGTLNTGSNNESLGENMLAGAAGGAILAPAAGAVGHGFAHALGARSIDPASAALAQQALDAGIPVYPSQLARGGLIRSAGTLLAQIPGTGVAEKEAVQRQAFTRAVSNTFGEDTPSLTPDVMSRAKTNIGNRIGEIADRNTITDTAPLIDDLAEIEHNASGVLENTAPIHKQIGNILDKIGPDGTLPGSAYQSLIRKGGPLDSLTSSGDPAKVKIGSDIRDALDDAFQNSVSGDDLAAFRAARLQYKNLMTVAPLAAKAQATGGEITPSLLQNRVTQNFKNRAFSGADQLGVLGDVGQRFVKPAPSSNTGENMLLLRMLSHAGSYAAGTAAGVLGLKIGLPPAEAALGGLATLGGAAAAGRAAGKVLTSPARTNSLIDAAFNYNHAPPIVPALTRGAIPVGAIESNRLRLVTKAP